MLDQFGWKSPTLCPVGAEQNAEARQLADGRVGVKPIRVQRLDVEVDHRAAEDIPPRRDPLALGKCLGREPEDRNGGLRRGIRRHGTIVHA
jgi:hypothetical protein